MGIIAHDLEGRIMFVNQTTCNNFGYTREELTGMDIDVLDPSAAGRDDQNEQWFRLNSSEFVVIESTHVRKDNSTYPAEITINALLYKGERIILATILDITERKKAEKALRLTMFSIEHASEVILWMGPDAKYTYVNDAACRMYGYSREKLLTMAVFDTNSEFTREMWGKHWEELKERKNFTFETINKNKDGHLFPVEVTVNYMEFENKEYNFAFVRDITERKKAEIALRASEENYRSIFENSVVGILRTSPEGQILSVNRFFANSIGFDTPEEMVEYYHDIGDQLYAVPGTGINV